MLVWRSLAADTIRSMSVTLHCMRHVVPSAYMPSTFLVVTRCVVTFVSYRAILSPLFLCSLRSDSIRTGSVPSFEPLSLSFSHNCMWDSIKTMVFPLQN